MKRDDITAQMELNVSFANEHFLNSKTSQLRQ